MTDKAQNPVTHAASISPLYKTSPPFLRNQRMAVALFLPAANILLYDEERGAAGLTGGGALARDGGPPMLLLVNGFVAVNCAVGLACWPLRKAVSEAEPWIGGCFYFVLLLLLLLGLVQLFLYASMAVGMAARRNLQGLAAPLGRVTGLLVLAAVAIVADCVF